MLKLWKFFKHKSAFFVVKKRNLLYTIIVLNGGYYGKNKNVKEITIKIEGKEWEDALDKAFEKANKKVKIDGFRQGKAPKEVFIKKYGEESLFMDAADLVLQPAYQKMLDENKDVEIVAQPEVALKSISKDGVEFVFTINN